MHIHPACHVDRVLLEAHWLLLSSVRLFFHTGVLPPPQFTLVVSISLNSPPFKFDFACIDAACNYIFTPSEVRQMPKCDFAILEVFHHVIQKKKMKICCVIASSHHHSYPDWITCITSTKQCYYVCITDSRL